jgi:hypothetical protein
MVLLSYRLPQNWLYGGERKIEKSDQCPSDFGRRVGLIDRLTVVILVDGSPKYHFYFFSRVRTLVSSFFFPKQEKLLAVVVGTVVVSRQQ